MIKCVRTFIFIEILPIKIKKTCFVYFNIDMNAVSKALSNIITNCTSTVEPTYILNYVLEFPCKYNAERSPGEIKPLSWCSMIRRKAIRGVGTEPQLCSDRSEARESAVHGTCVRRRDR